MKFLAPAEQLCTYKNPSDQTVQADAKIRKKIYTCQLCHVLIIFPNLKTHFSLIHNIETFSCNICVQIFWTKETYKSHICGIQKNNFLKRKMVSSHEDSMENKENMGPKQQLKKNQLEKSENSLEIPEEGKGCKRYSCMLCTAKFVLTKNLKIHFRDNHRIEVYDCDVCGKIFLAKNLLENHSKIHKTSLPPNPILMNKILPAKKYPHNQVLLTKIRSVKTIKCKICKEKFLTKEELQNHKDDIHSESTEIHIKSNEITIESTEIHNESKEMKDEKNSVLEEINLKSPPGSGIKTSVQDILSNSIMHSSEIRGLCSTKCSSETLQNLLYFIKVLEGPIIL